MKKLLATVALLAVVVFALPWALGTQLQRVYETALTRLQEQGIRVLDSRYRRGWFSSDASVRIGLPPGAVQPLDAGAIPLRIESEIVHGPWDLGALRLSPFAALIESRVELLLPGKAPPALLLRTEVALDGSGAAEIRTPAVSHPTESAGVKTEEGWGELKFAAGFADAEGRLALPSVSLSTPEGFRIDLRDLRAQAEGSRWIGALHTGEGTMSLERAELRAPDANLLAVGLSVTGKTLPEGGLWSMELAYRIEEVSLNGVAYGPSRVSFSVRRLPADALASFFRAMQELSAGPRDPSLTVVAAAAILVERLPLLLADDPRLTFDPVEVATPEGAIRGRLSLGSQGLTRQALEQPGAWLEHLVGDGELSLPRPLLLRLLEEWQRSQLLEQLQRRGQEMPTLSETLDTEIALAARDRLDVLVREGWLVEEAGGLAARAKLADTLLTINGKTIPVGAAAVP